MKLILFISTIILPLLGCEYELENFNTYIKRMNLQRAELIDKKLEHFLTELMLDNSCDLHNRQYILMDAWGYPHSSMNSGYYEFYISDFEGQSHLMRQFDIQYYLNIEGHIFFLRNGWVDELYITTSERKKFAFEIMPIPMICDIHSYYIKYSVLDKNYYIYKKIW